jgi:hypothetical protein
MNIFWLINNYFLAFLAGFSAFSSLSAFLEVLAQAASFW